MTERAPQIDRDRAVRLAWASEALEVHATASAAEVRAAFLRSLAEEGFVPSNSRHEAFRLLQHDLADPEAKDDLEPIIARPVPETPEACLRAQEEALLVEVDAFACGFFQQTPSERRETWRELEARAREFVRVQARLEGLAPGLNVELGRLDPDAPELRELAERLCQIFVLRPLPRAALRERFIDEWEAERSKWQMAARLLANRHSDIAALDSPLVNYLSKSTATTPATKPLVLPPEINGETKRSDAWWGGAAVFFVVLFLRFIFVGGCDPSRSSRHPDFPKLSDKETQKLLDDLKNHRGVFERLRKPGDSAPLDPRTVIDSSRPPFSLDPKSLPQVAPKMGPELPPGYPPSHSPLLPPTLLPNNDLDDDDSDAES